MVKMIRCWFIVCAWLTAMCGVLAQVSPGPEGPYLRTNVLRAVDFVNPGINLGIGYQGSTFSVEAEYTVLFSTFLNKQVKVDRGRILSLGTYYTLPGAHERAYTEIGLRMDHLRSDYRTVQTFDYVENTGNFDSLARFPPYSDSLRINKATYTINLLLRRTHVFGHFFLSYHAGVGLRYRRVEQLGRQDENDLYAGNHPTVWQYADDPQPKITVALPVSLSVGYRF